MLRLSDAIDDNALVIIQRMFMQFLHSSTALYEADGTYVYNVFEGKYCSYLSKISYEKAGNCTGEAISSGKWICHEDCLKTSKESIEKMEPVERECCAGINIYAVPIIYNDQVLGSINAAITNPPLERSKLESIAKLFGISERDLTQRVYAHKRIVHEEMEIARMQIRMAALLISSLYESKVKQIEAETELKRQKERLEAIIENVSNGVFLLNKDNTVTFLNQQAQNFFYNRNEYKYTGDSYKHTEYFDKVGNKILPEQLPGIKAMKGEKVEEFFLTAKRPDKTLHYNVSGCPIYDTDGNISAALLCSHDITALINSERELLQQNEQLNSIIDSVSDALFVFDREGNYVLRNKAALKYKYSSKQTNIKQSFFSYAKCLDMEGNQVHFSELPVNRVQNGQKVEEQILAVQLPSEIRYYSFNGSPLYNEDGSFRIGVLCVRDITEQVMREEKIKQQQDLLLKAERTEKNALANAMKMKDEFLTTITHEFKTPLTVINAAIQAINSLYGSQIPDNAKKHIQRIRINSFRQLRLVNNLLDITRYNAGHIKLLKQNLDIVFLSRAITESVIPFAKQKEVNLYFSSKVEYKEIAIDDEKYERILLNLLSNAIKFTPKGKSIHVDLFCKTRKVIIAVKDEGVGIPKGKQELIFERFGQVDSSLTRQAEGTGIGLSLVSALISTLGGTISLDSEIGKGSTFTVTLPAARLRRSVLPHDKLQQSNRRIMQAVEVEFSDIYAG